MATLTAAPTSMVGRVKRQWKWQGSRYYNLLEDSTFPTTCIKVAGLVGADPKEIIWTSGATESNNIAVKGVGRFYKGKKKHVVTTQTEHKCEYYPLAKFQS